MAYRVQIFTLPYYGVRTLISLRVYNSSLDTERYETAHACSTNYYCN
jgi:hypothetical protein